MAHKSDQPLAATNLTRTLSAPPRLQPAPSTESLPTRILAVDDNESIRVFLRHFFRLEGLPVEIIASPHEALSRFRAAPQDYAMLMTDCEMPGMNGLELARQVRQVRSDLPMLIFSTSVSVNGAERFLQFGFQAALPKPVALEQLRSTVRKLLEGDLPSPPAPAANLPVQS